VAAQAAAAHTAPGGCADVSAADKLLCALLMTLEQQILSSNKCCSKHFLRGVAFDSDCSSHCVTQLAACCRYSPVLVATYALHDLVSAWRYATDRWLCLHDSAAVRLLGIASRYLQQKADEAAALTDTAAAAPLDAGGSSDSGVAADQQHAAVMQPAGNPADDAEPQQVAGEPDEQEPPSPRTPDRAEPGETLPRVHTSSEGTSISATLPASCCVPNLAWLLTAGVAIQHPGEPNANHTEQCQHGEQQRQQGPREGECQAAVATLTARLQSDLQVGRALLQLVPTSVVVCVQTKPRPGP
jgi:hypothetical protein